MSTPDWTLLAQIAETEPGLVRTLILLADELASSDLNATALRELGEHIQRIGCELTAQANRIIIDQH